MNFINFPQQAYFLNSDSSLITLVTVTEKIIKNGKVLYQVESQDNLINEYNLVFKEEIKNPSSLEFYGKSFTNYPNMSMPLRPINITGKVERNNKTYYLLEDYPEQLFNPMWITFSEKKEIN